MYNKYENISVITNKIIRLLTDYHFSLYDLEEFVIPNLIEEVKKYSIILDTDSSYNIKKENEIKSDKEWLQYGFKNCEPC